MIGLAAATLVSTAPIAAFAQLGGREGNDDGVRLTSYETSKTKASKHKASAKHKPGTYGYSKGKLKEMR
jgi:hypothetical protein